MKEIARPVWPVFLGEGDRYPCGEEGAGKVHGTARHGGVYCYRMQQPGRVLSLTLNTPPEAEQLATAGQVRSSRRPRQGSSFHMVHQVSKRTESTRQKLAT